MCVDSGLILVSWLVDYKAADLKHINALLVTEIILFVVELWEVWKIAFETELNH